MLIAKPLVEVRPLLFDLLTRGVVGPDEQIPDDDLLRVAQRRDGHDGREPAPVLADVGQLVDVLDPARGLEDEGFEPRRDRRRELQAQRRGARDQLLWVGDVGRRDLVRHVGGRVPEHPLGADVEDLNDPFRVGGDAGEVRAVEDGALERARLQQGLGLLDFRAEAKAVGGALYIGSGQTVSSLRRAAWCPRFNASTRRAG